LEGFNVVQLRNLAWILVIIGCTQNASSGQVIDFETFPDGTIPTDGQSISNQYESAFGVTFSLETGESPVIAKVGPPRTAFAGFGGDDMPRPDINVGQSFLTDDGVVGAPPSPLIIDYSVPVQGASGVIIDIDFSEQWTVEAYDAADKILDSIVLTPAGNGSASPWRFDFPTPVINRIRIRYTGGGGNNIGLAFDNFSPASGFLPPLVTIEADGGCGTTCSSNDVELVANLVGGVPPFVYDWQEEVNAGVWTSIGSDPTITVSPQTSTTYRIVITDADKESVTSDPFPLTVCAGSNPFDADQDGDVDMVDFAAFQAAFTGPNN
jgi:hypothetical protein